MWHERFHSSDVEDSHRLGYDARDKRVSVLGVAWKWQRDAPPKRWHQYTSFYGVMSKNTGILIIYSLTDSLFHRSHAVVFPSFYKQGVPFIVSLNTIAFPRWKPAYTGTSRDSCGVQGRDKWDTCTRVIFRPLVMFIPACLTVFGGYPGILDIWGIRK
jgi:hypothetical protein